MPYTALCLAVLLPLVPAVILFKALPGKTDSADVSGKLQGMEIKLGGAFAGYFSVLLVVVANHTALFPPPPPPPPPAPVDQVWTVEGQVVDEQTGQPLDPLGLDNVTLSDPTPFNPTPSGTFSLKYYSTGADGYPKLSITQNGYETVCISLDPSKTPVPGCQSIVDHTGNTVSVGSVKLQKLGTPYPPNLPAANKPGGGQ
jgi:hypothetical protein